MKKIKDLPPAERRRLLKVDFILHIVGVFIAVAWTFIWPPHGTWAYLNVVVIAIAVGRLGWVTVMLRRELA